MWPHSAAPTQQCSRGCSPAGGLRDPSPSENPAQPGDPVCLPGQVRGGRPPLQTGVGGPGEDLWTRPPRCGHHAQHPGLGLQVRNVSICSPVFPVSCCPPLYMHFVKERETFSLITLSCLSLSLMQGSEQIQRGCPSAQRCSVHPGENPGQRPSCCKTLPSSWQPYLQVDKSMFR